MEENLCRMLIVHTVGANKLFRGLPECARINVWVKISIDSVFRLSIQDFLCPRKVWIANETGKSGIFEENPCRSPPPMTPMQVVIVVDVGYLPCQQAEQQQIL